MRQKFLGPLQQDRRRRIGGGHRRERLGAADKIAAAPARQCMRIGGCYDFLLGSFFVVARKRLVDADRFVAALDADAVQLAPGEAWRTFERAFGGHDRGAEYLLAPSSRDATFTLSPITV